MKRTFIVAAALMLSVFATKASNVTVSNVSLTGQNVSAGLNNVANYTNVKFDVSWENSWKVSGTGTPNNWDAVWVFVKFKEAGTGQQFQHAILSTDPANYSVGTTNGVGATITPSPDGMGVFIYRSGDGSGNINWQDVNLRWMYRTSPNAVHDTMNVTLQVFAIEMVYIPEGSFYLGDGNMSFYPSTSAFRVNSKYPTIPKGNEAYLVQSENAITFENSSSSSLTGCYDPWYPSGYTVPATYPKGYQAFYCMKYEISQKQYIDFFNTLNNTSTTQKSYRNISNTNSYRNAFSWSGTAGADATLYNSASGDRAQNWLEWSDGCAYADWAGLRPMSDFEYEKVCRGHADGIGPIYPVNLEYSWGNAIIKYPIASLVNDNTTSEKLNASDTANCNYNNTTYAAGPLRNGIFAAKNATSFKRRASGASFYGVMELTGNLFELVISCYQPVWSVAPRQSTFTSSIHGDGVLAASGNANIMTWSHNDASEVALTPSFSTSSSANYGYANKTGNVVRKGGSWSITSPTTMAVSYRSGDAMPYGQSLSSYGTPIASNPLNVTYTRQKDNGFRCVRTAP